MQKVAKELTGSATTVPRKRHAEEIYGTSDRSDALVVKLRLTC